MRVLVNFIQLASLALSSLETMTCYQQSLIM